MRVLTRSGWGVAVAGVAALASGILFGIPELLICGVTITVLLAIAAIVTTLTPLRLEVIRTLHPDRVHAGTASRVEVVVRNRGRRRTPVLELHDAVTGTAGADLLLAPLERSGRVRAAYRLPTQRRGIISVGPLDLELGDPFGMTRASVTAAPTTTLIVYPAVDDIPPPPRSEGADPHGWRTPGLQTGGDDFHSLRPYVVGDDLRRIHWPTTARRDELTVRQHEIHQQGRTTILLDTRAAVHTDATFEGAVSAAASLVVAAAEQGDEVRLVATDGRDSGYVAGNAALTSVLEYLAAVEANESGGRGDLRVDHPGTLVVLTTPRAAPSAEALGPGRRFLVLFEWSSTERSRQDVRAGGALIRVPEGGRFADAWVSAMAAPALESVR